MKIKTKHWFCLLSIFSCLLEHYNVDIHWGVQKPAFTHMVFGIIHSASIFVMSPKYYNISMIVSFVAIALFVGVYHLNAQEPDPVPVETPAEQAPPEEPNPPVENPPVEEPSSPPVEEEPEPEPEDDGSFLGDLIDLVEDAVTGNDEEEVPAEVPEEIVEPVVEEVLESIPAPITINKPFIPIRGELNIKKDDIDYTNGSYACDVSPFSVNISNSSEESVIKIQNINQVGSSDRQIEIGKLPSGLKVVFPGDTYEKKITTDETEFTVSIAKDSFAQRGSFTIPVFYSVGDITVMCQMNVVNNG